jgi:ParB family chromosome partitioning protein
VSRKVLGRGLSALIPEREVPRAAAPGGRTEPRRDYFKVAIEEIHPTVDQPRKRFDEEALGELVESIRHDGVLQPLLVRQRAQAEGGGFAIIAGERRWRAAQRAGLKDVPVVVRETTPREAFALALVENLQREDLNPIEEAEAFQRLLDEHGLTQEQMAERVGKDRSTIANALRLLKLPRAVREMVEQGELSMGQARALLGLDSADAIEGVAHRVAAGQLSVRQVEAMVRRTRSPVAAKAATSAAKGAAVRDLEQRLQRALGTRVRVLDEGGRGRIEISWSSLDELDRLLDVMLRRPG